MKKVFFIGLLFWFAHGFSQATCGFDEVLKQAEQKYPELKQKRLALEESLRKEGYANAASRLQQKFVGKKVKTAKGTLQTIYEIPVVVHVIVPANSPLGSAFNPTDEQIKEWIKKTNDIYSCNYTQGGYSPEGTGPDSGTVIPFRLVLAKRDINCNTTSGIVRYDASGNDTYNSYGVKSFGLNGNGLTTQEIRSLANHWIEKKYFNIYLINKISGNGIYSGLLGWASFITNTDSEYDSFMKCAVTSDTGYVLSHEIGHALGLFHPFVNGNIENSGATANSHSLCYPQGNFPECETQNDYVCDTAPTKSISYSYASTPSLNDKNECTGENFDGIQYNVMNYTNDPKKFTPGQRDRVLAQFLNLRGSLTESPALQNSNLDKTACIPATVTPSPAIPMVGPTSVKLGTLNNTSDSNINIWPYAAYEDFTGRCASNFTAEFETGSQQTIQVSFKTVDQSIKVWIDYNNDGIFESNELVAGENNIPLQNGETTWTANFTIPINAKIGVPLRMRVKADNGVVSEDACSALNDGQVEDYAIKFLAPVQYTISATPNPDGAATITGTGVYQAGKTATLSFTPKLGYQFISWKENGVEVSTNPNYSFPVTGNRSLEAFFKQQYIISATFNLPFGYTIGQGQYDPGTQVSLTAYPYPSYDFLNWEEDGKEISANRTITLVADKNRSFRANFMVKNFPSGSIVRREYWFDNDYTNKINTDIFPYNQTVLLNDPVKIIDENMQTNIQPGLHTLNYRFQDSSGKWSSAITDFFYKNTNLVNAEYWFDNNYANKKTVSGINGDIYTFQNPFINNLDDKLHTLNFRAQDGSGKWSSTVSAYFMLQSQIVAYEYWFNADYANKSYNAVSPTNLLDINTNFSVLGFNLTAGTNVLHFRTKNNFGKWSSTIDTEFTMGATLGVEINETVKDVTVVPNPFNEEILVKSATQNISNIYIHDLSGKLIKEFGVSNLREFKLKELKFPSGLYYLTIITKQSQQTFKIIKK